MGSRENFLRRVADIQALTLEYTSKGVTQEWVYRNVIYPRYYISRQTYYRYLSLPAKRMLMKGKKGGSC